VLYCCNRVSTKYVLYCCHQMSTKLQLKIININYVNFVQTFNLLIHFHFLLLLTSGGMFNIKTVRYLNTQGGKLLPVKFFHATLQISGSNYNYYFTAQDHYSSPNCGNGSCCN
jgi:hypothetical protein